MLQTYIQWFLKPQAAKKRSQPGTHNLEMNCSFIFLTLFLSCQQLSQVLGTIITVCLPTEKKPNYLKALSNIVNKLPKQVQVTELPAVSLL